MNYIITDKNGLITGFVGIGGAPIPPPGYSVYEIYYGDIPIQARTNLNNYKYDGHTFDRMTDHFIRQCHVEEYRATKIKSMSSICNKMIVNGIDIGEEHYSLTVEDQLNITRLGIKADDPNNTDTLLYHADGQPLRVYTKEEMSFLYHKAMTWVDYNAIYFNLLKQRINILENVDDILPIAYNSELPPGYKDQLAELIDITPYDFNILVITDNADYSNIIPVINAVPSGEEYEKFMKDKFNQLKTEIYDDSNKD